jgi:hypothetical protein
MANAHRYGFRFARSISGNDTPQVFSSPIATTYQPATIVGAGTAVNLNIGDPIMLREDGTIALVQQGQAADGSDSDDFATGIVVGFPRVIVGGYPRPGSFYTGATAYSGGIGSDSAPLVAWIPVAGNIFEIDCDTAHSTPTKAGFLALVGGTGNMVYSVLTAGNGQPKANPLLDVSDVVLNSAEINQLRVVGLGKAGDAMDFTDANVTLQVMWNELMPQPSDILAGVSTFIE